MQTIKESASDALLATTLAGDVGSPESRASARMLLAKTPVFISVYYKPNRNELGELGPPIECGSRTATVNGVTLVREPGESLADFRLRAIAACPALVHGFVQMNGDGDGEPGRAVSEHQPSRIVASRAVRAPAGAFCEPHRERVAEDVPAVFLAGKTPMCRSCFVGKPIFVAQELEGSHCQRRFFLKKQAPKNRRTPFFLRVRNRKGEADRRVSTVAA